MHESPNSSQPLDVGCGNSSIRCGGSSQETETAPTCATSDIRIDACTDDIALFVSGSPAGVDAVLLRELALRATFILAVDSGAEQLVAADITPDLLLGDFDSISPSTLRRLEVEGVPVQSYDPYKNSTDVELGVEELHSRGFRRLIATNVLGGRTDHALGSLGALASAAHTFDMEVALRDTHEVCYFVSSNASQRILELRFEHSQCESQRGQPPFPGDNPPVDQPLLPPPPNPQHVSLMAWGGAVVVSLQGTEWPLDYHVLSPYSARGISNVLRSDVLHFELHEGNGTTLLLLSYRH